MAQTTIDRLIIDSPHGEPRRHCRYDRETRLFDQVDGRRPASKNRDGYCYHDNSWRSLQ